MSKQMCDYGCGQEAKHQFKNGKWCCSKNFTSCPTQRRNNSIRIKKVWKDPNYKCNLSSYRKKRSSIMKEIWEDPNSIFNSDSFREKRSNIMKEIWEDPNSGLNSNIRSEKISNKIKEIWDTPNNIYNSISRNEKISKSLKINIEQINERYPFFSKIEGMRYNPNKPGEKEIQVRCKNHECKNSKEKGGWFVPIGRQLSERYNALEKDDGNDGNYLYCSQECKDNCGLYNLKGDPYRDTGKPYTLPEQGTFNKFILKRDNEICYYCGEHTATIVHHLRPQKLEPFFALDPDYAISVCAKCHYKYGHPTGSEHSTGNLAKIVCSVESQKFLNQK